MQGVYFDHRGCVYRLANFQVKAGLSSTPNPHSIALSQLAGDGHRTVVDLTSMACGYRWAAVSDEEWPQQQAQREVMLADFDFKSGFGDRSE